MYIFRVNGVWKLNIGGNKGTENTFLLEPNEYINSVQCRANNNYVVGICIKTTNGRTNAFGPFYGTAKIFPEEPAQVRMVLADIKGMYKYIIIYCVNPIYN